MSTKRSTSPATPLSSTASGRASTMSGSNNTNWANYANVSGLTRRYGTFPQDPSLNFPPTENFRTRSIASYNAETYWIDVIMYRITDRQHTDAILAAKARGVGVRLITEPEQYRDPTRLWHAWNVDRLYMGGVEIRHRAHLGLAHQKSVILYGPGGRSSSDPPTGPVRPRPASSNTTCSRRSRTLPDGLSTSSGASGATRPASRRPSAFTPLPPTRRRRRRPRIKARVW